MEKNEKKVIRFTIEGKGITPASLGKELIHLLDDLYSLTEVYSAEPIGITAVESNCITIRFLVPLIFTFTSINAIQICNPHISLGQASQYACNVNKFLEKNKATLFCFDNEIEIARYDGNEKQIPFCEIHPEKSYLSLYGELVNVGGSENINIHLKTPIRNKLIKLDVSKLLAKKLAPNLFSSVGVRAEVEMLNGDIIKGRVVDIIDYAPQSQGCWLQKEALPFLGEEYSNVNVEGFLNNLRGETDSNE